MKRYSPKDIEPKWQKQWQESGIYAADLDSEKPKFVGFGMFNYPSGAGIHVGHVRNFTIPDVVTRAKRQQGFESYQPVGWDSFGLPAENYAIKTGVSPQESIKSAIDKYHEQYSAMGWAVDWSKEISTTDPSYYRWTQWCFLKLFEHGLAYQKESPQWWCETDKTVLADEQVEAGRCWRCGNLVVKKNLKQWFFKITDYADELLEATDSLDWTQSVKSSQKAWIGKSIGAEISFSIDGSDEKLQVFTTRPDTVFGATFIVVAPEHKLLNTLSNEYKDSVSEYIAKSTAKSEVERQQTADKEKTGVFTGLYAVNPANSQKIPVWTADYVLMGYGTGAIMAVPAHDERDNEFAKKFELPVVEVVEASAGETEGVLKNSEGYNGLNTADAREKIVADLAVAGTASERTNYKMRDWLVSRQRYWGAPIPIVHCEKDGAVALPESELPLELPQVEKYMPTGDNTSVLAGVADWVNTTCPKCGGPAKRETDTMDGYVCSSWYFLRYLDPENSEEPWSKARADKWMPINFYNGGDHATAHLLYARFFNRFFHKLGLVSQPEPFQRMVFNGKIKASDGSAFSKSKGNGIDPLEVIEEGYGADAIRLYEMFAAPVEFDVLWDTQGIPGAYRFISRVWTLVQEFAEASDGPADDAAILRAAHRTAKKVTEDIENFQFNTAIAAQMELTNELYKNRPVTRNQAWKYALETLVCLMAPFAPHAAEELWHDLGHDESVHKDNWPQWEDKYLTDDSMKIAVQVNGKLRGEISVPSEIPESEIIAAALNDEKVKAYITAEPKKTIYVRGRLVNIVV